jgi:hypothetical protein
MKPGTRVRLSTGEVGYASPDRRVASIWDGVTYRVMVGGGVRYLRWEEIAEEALTGETITDGEIEALRAEVLDDSRDAVLLGACRDALLIGASYLSLGRRNEGRAKVAAAINARNGGGR